ncbi:MAG: hypothetical protein WC140_04105 [Bacteroidales bacterium]
MKNIKTFLLVLAIALITVPATAKVRLGQTKDSTTYDFYGFIRNYFATDSRQNKMAGEEQFYLYPLDEYLDDNGNDINAAARIRLLAITTRLGLDITANELWGAIPKAKIEADFNGFSGYPLLCRLRQAYIELDWGKQDILIGKTWHPITSSVMPDVFSLASGSPFNPFSRTQMVKYTYKKNNLRFIGAALFQSQYLSVGPDGASSDYDRNSLSPELYLSADYKSNNFFFGGGIDLLRLKPRLFYTNNTATFKTNDYINSFSGLVYAEYKQGLFTAKAKSIYAENTAQLFMVSGFAMKEQDSVGNASYLPMRSQSTWLTASYGKETKIAAFLGYMKNFGTTENCTEVYMRGPTNMDKMFRLSANVMHTYQNLVLGLELENTSVWYGNTINFDSTVTDTHIVSNLRCCIMVKYLF